MVMLLLLSYLIAQACTREAICVIVRTYFAQKYQLTTLLMSVNGALKSPGNDYGVLFYIVDTESLKTPSRFIQRAITTTESYYPDAYYERVVLTNFTPSHATYGFEDTDLMIQRILTSNYAADRSCTYFLITNGDNYYSSYLFEHVKSHVASHTDLIAFSFINRKVCINTEFRKGRIDLGSVLISRRAFAETNAKFMPKGYATEDMYFTRVLLKEVLFLHF
jgi:hypothetical protein